MINIKEKKNYFILKFNMIYLYIKKLSYMKTNNSQFLSFIFNSLQSFIKILIIALIWIKLMDFFNILFDNEKNSSKFHENYKRF